MKYQLKTDGEVSKVSLGRDIDELAGEALASLATLPAGQQIIFDCKAVARISSSGIIAWIRGLHHISHTSYRFANCSEQFLDAGLLIASFLGVGRIESIAVQMTCHHCQRHEVKMIAALAGQPPSLQGGECKCAKCGNALDPANDLRGTLELLDERGAFKQRA